MTMADFAKGMFELDGATEHKNILIYGGPGSGKTVLAGTVPGRLLFLAGEPGYISAARLGARGQARLIPDTATAVAAAAWLEDGNASKFDWIVADGVGTMQNKFLLNYTAEAYDANPAKRAGRNLPDKPDYFNAQNFLKSWVARLIDLPCNVIFTAHAMFPEDKATGEQLVYPSIQGKGYEISSYICGLMHAVGYMSPRTNAEGEPVRRILWQSVRDPNLETTYFAKDQFDALGTFTDVKLKRYMMPEIIAQIDSGVQNPQEDSAPANPVEAAVETATKARTTRRAPVRRK
jgi:hypothetical protein